MQIRKFNEPTWIVSHRAGFWLLALPQRREHSVPSKRNGLEICFASPVYRSKFKQTNFCIQLDKLGIKVQWCKGLQMLVHNPVCGYKTFVSLPLWSKHKDPRKDLLLASIELAVVEMADYSFTSSDLSKKIPFRYLSVFSMSLPFQDLPLLCFFLLK